MRNRCVLSLTFIFCGLIYAADEIPQIVGTFPQEVTTVYSTEQGLPSNDAMAVCVSSDGTVYAGTKTGIARFEKGAWQHPASYPAGVVPALAPAAKGILAVVGETAYNIDGDTVEPIAKVPGTAVHAILPEGEKIWLATDGGLYSLDGKTFVIIGALGQAMKSDAPVFAIAADGAGKVVVGTAVGLFESRGGRDWRPVYPADDKDRSWAPIDVRGVAFDAQSKLWFACPQGVGSESKTWTLYTGKDGLPYNKFTTMARGESGVVWFGTSLGAIRFDGKVWEYRQGRRWLPADDVRSIAVDAKGNAWFATAEGVGVIERRPMTLAEKAKYYEDDIDKYNRRTEYGYVLECAVDKPGDKSVVHNHDSDNDGLWTAMYGTGECFAYAATKDPKAKERAKKAFEALRFLSVAPIDGEVKQQPGFVARTVVPTTEKNPNLEPGYSLKHQQEEHDTSDKLWKVYTPRWPESKDKKYWYKSDTSSDELDGHYFFYPAYFDLCADTDAEKDRVREVVRNLTDHLVRNNFRLVDFDGTVTRWGTYSPDDLNHNYNWFAERGLKSLSMLSYLTVAEHITGDAKYGEIVKKLCDEFAYNTNAMNTKLQRGIGSGNQSDDEMAVMSYYNIIKYTKDPKLKNMMLYSYNLYWTLDQPELNPFFNFAYAASGLHVMHTNQWATRDMSPWPGWLDDAVDTLKRFPLDRFNWGHTNSKRLDLVMLGLHAVDQDGPLVKPNKGYRVDGKVLPVDERFFNHWNTDPWDLDYPGDGRELADGAVFLLPYYMGLYHGYIK